MLVKDSYSAKIKTECLFSALAEHKCGHLTEGIVG